MSKLRGKQTGFATAVVAVVLLVAGGAFAAGKWEKVRVGDLEVQYNGGFSPTTLSKTKPTPITFNVAAKIASLDPEEKHPPALREFVIQGDKHAAINVSGIPVCRSQELQSTPSAVARKV